MKITKFLKDLFLKSKMKKIKCIENYYSQKYKIQNAKNVDIPYFIKAKQEVKKLIKNKQLDSYYSAIKRGLA